MSLPLSQLASLKGLGCRVGKLKIEIGVCRRIERVLLIGLVIRRRYSICLSFLQIVRYVYCLMFSVGSDVDVALDIKLQRKIKYYDCIQKGLAPQ